MISSDLVVTMYDEVLYVNLPRRDACEKGGTSDLPSEVQRTIGVLAKPSKITRSSRRGLGVTHSIGRKMGAL